MSTAIRILLVEPRDADAARIEALLRTLASPAATTPTIHRVHDIPSATNALRSHEFDLVLLSDDPTIARDTRGVHELEGTTAAPLVPLGTPPPGSDPPPGDTDEPTAAARCARNGGAPTLALALERARLERELRETRAFTDAIVETLGAHVAVIDEHGVITSVNESWRRFASDNGDPFAGAVGSNYFEACLGAIEHNRTLDRYETQEDTRTALLALEGLQSVLRDELPVFEMEYPCHAPDARRWYLMRAVRLGGSRHVVVSHRDVTGVRHVEEALDRSEREYRALFDNALDAIVVFDPHRLTIHNANRHACALLGVEAGALVGQNLEAFAVDVGSARELVDEILQRGEGHSFHTALRRPDGSLIHVEVSASTIDYHGSVAILALCRDISARRGMEAKLRDVEARYRNLIEQLPVITYTVDLKPPSHTVFISPQVESILGYTQEEWLADDTLWLRVIHPEDRDRVARQVEDRDSTGRAFDIEYRAVARDSRVVWIRNRSRHVHDGNHRPLHAHGVMIDITEHRHAVDALARSEERYRQLFDHANDIVYSHDLKGRFTDFNRAGERILGFKRDEMLRLNFRDVIPREQHGTIDALLATAPTRGPIGIVELDIMTKGGDRRTLEVSPRLRFVDGRPYDVQGIARDITERKRTERLEANRRYALEAIAQDLPLIETLQRVVRMIEAHLPHAVACIHVREGPVSGLHATEAGTGLGMGVERNEKTVTAPAGHPHAYGSAIPGATGDELGVVHAFRRDRDETETATRGILELASQLAKLALERYSLRARLAHQATHDILTGLPNRLVLEDSLRSALSSAQRNDRSVGVLFVDLDRFKTVNDMLGHHVGDALLREVSERLRHEVRDDDVLARVGGDEFALVLNDLRDVQDAVRIAQKLIRSLARPFRHVDRELFISASIGISVFPQDGASPDGLLRNADAAMYRAKLAGKNNFQLFTAAMNQEALERLELENHLRHAAARGELTLHYQPQVSLASGRVIAAEALLRWNHTTLGGVSPGRFIPLAEETGLIVPIGNWVLHEACRQARAWLDAGQALRIAVNVSKLQFARPGFAREVTDCIARHGLPPDLLELEVTESVVMHDLDEVIEGLAALRHAGVRVSIDDFGTGHSSLAYLQRLPVTQLKIDRSFVAGLGAPDAKGPRAVLEAIVTLAHALDLDVVAEGVETTQQLDDVRLAGCDVAQGFLLGRPVAPGGLELGSDPPASDAAVQAPADVRPST